MGWDKCVRVCVSVCVCSQETVPMETGQTKHPVKRGEVNTEGYVCVCVCVCVCRLCMCACTVHK